MANSLTAFNPEYWAATMQTVRFRETVALGLANTEYRSVLSNGDTLNKPYRSRPVVKTYTKATDIVSVDRSATNEYLTVDTAEVVPFYVDDLDRVQNKWNSVDVFATDAMRALSSKLDQKVLGEYASATHTVDAGSVGGSAGSAITLTQSTAQPIFSAAARKLDSYDVTPNNRFACIGPRFLETLRNSLSGRETSFGDQVGVNGSIGSRFGFNIYFSNNIAFSAVLTTGTITTADTVTIAGVTFTFKTTAATTGEVDLASDAAGTSLLVDAINNTNDYASEAGLATTYFELSAANRAILSKYGIKAVLTDATHITISGYGDVIVSTTGADMSWGSEVEHSLFGIKGATDLVLQKSPSVEFRMAEKRLGRYVYPWQLYGAKTFADMADALVDVQVDASDWV